jgi:hypothetical protein
MLAEMINASQIAVAEANGKRLLWKNKGRWIDSITIYGKEIGRVDVDWLYLVQGDNSSVTGRTNLEYLCDHLSREEICSTELVREFLD